MVSLGPSRLVIEIHGSQHIKMTDSDQSRTDWLESQRFRVVRFWDNDVLCAADEVLEAVRNALQSPRLIEPCEAPLEMRKAN